MIKKIKEWFKKPVKEKEPVFVGMSENPFDTPQMRAFDLMMAHNRGEIEIGMGDLKRVAKGETSRHQPPNQEENSSKD
jgi:hypothetical protein